jgi:hypothetical protein
MRYSKVAGFGGSGPAVDGHGTSMVLNNPTGIVAIPEWGNDMLITDQSGLLRRYNVKQKTISTFAGDITSPGASSDGIGTSAQFNIPGAITRGPDGAIYVSEISKIRKITLDGTVTTLAGDGTVGFADGVGAAAKFNTTLDVGQTRHSTNGGLAVSQDNQFLIISDSQNHRIRRLDFATNNVTTIIGTGVKMTFQNKQGLGPSPVLATILPLNKPGAILMQENGFFFVTARLMNILFYSYETKEVSYVVGGFLNYVGDDDNQSEGDTFSLNLFGHPRSILPPITKIGQSGDILNIFDMTRFRTADIVTRDMNSIIGLTSREDVIPRPCNNVEGIGSNAKLCEPWGAAMYSDTEILFVDKSSGGIGKIEFERE